MPSKPGFHIQQLLHSKQIIPRLIWLALGLIASWVLAEYGMLLLAPTLALPQHWPTALSIVILIFLALEGHTWAHHKSSGSPAGKHSLITRMPFGDVSQVWPASHTNPASLWAIIAGPLFNALLALVSLLIWNMQLHPILDAITFALALFNAVIALLNMVPAYPLDGGRLWQAILQTWLPMQQARRIAYWGSIVLLIALAAWGIYLISLQARFSLETGAGVVAAAMVLALGLRYPANNQAHQQAISPTRKPLLILASLLIGLTQLGVAVALLPMVDGMYAPGPAVAIGPMITIPAERRSQETRGALLLTTVITQTPITLGQWLWAHISPAYVLVPPERVIPVDMTPQQLIQRNVSMLEESEATAIVVGLRLAGFEAELTSTMLQITSVAEESPSAHILNVGDIIISADGVQTPNMQILRQQLAQRNAGEQISLEIERDMQREYVQIQLMAPTENSQIPRIGVALQPLGLDTVLPFPVRITTQKIVGGPSAGLMFSLAVYDAATAGDLTQGWRIAGTGTISLDGSVGPIGGIAQKVAGAEWAGAEYFILPREHEQEARKAARHIKLIPVSNAQEAIQALQTLPAHP